MYQIVLLLLCVLGLNGCSSPTRTYDPVIDDTSPIVLEIGPVRDVLYDTPESRPDTVISDDGRMEIGPVSDVFVQMDNGIEIGPVTIDAAVVDTQAKDGGSVLSTDMRLWKPTLSTPSSAGLIIEPSKFCATITFANAVGVKLLAPTSLALGIYKVSFQLTSTATTGPLEYTIRTADGYISNNLTCAFGGLCSTEIVGPGILDIQVVGRSASLGATYCLSDLWVSST